MNLKLQLFVWGIFLLSFYLDIPGGFGNTFMVTTTQNADPGSMRQAIVDANNSAGPDTILFNIPITDPNYNSTTGVWTIRPLTNFPHITDDGLLVDGFSQLFGSHSLAPVIEIDGNETCSAGFWINSANNTIRGFIINRFSSTGIALDGDQVSGNIIAGNFIGTDATGQEDLGNTFNGIILHHGAHKNIIGGSAVVDRNVISGNDQAGIVLQGTGVDSNLIIGNYIGTDITGSLAIENGRGIFVDYGPRGNVIGGLSAAERNIVSGNHETGVWFGKDVSDNRVLGNYIGTDASGTTALGNLSGVLLRSGATDNDIGGTIPGAGNLISGNRDRAIHIMEHGTDRNRICGNYIGTDWSGTKAIPNINGINIVLSAKHNYVGGNLYKERNIISGNTAYGIYMNGVGTDSNFVCGNIIGLDAGGLKILGNGEHGIWIGSGAKKNTIGGMAEGEANVISGNLGNGIIIYGSGADSNVVQSNLIGTDTSRTLQLGNSGHGIMVSMGASYNLIGRGNVITFNQRYGVFIGTDSSICNTVTENSISANEKGIHLSSGANNGMSAPVIEDATVSSVSGTAAPESNVEIFSDPADQGKIYEGSVMAESDGHFIWYGTVIGPHVTAVATDAAGNTSEFSSAFVTYMKNAKTSNIPQHFSLFQNYPNPFNGETTFSYQLPNSSFVNLSIFCVNGRLVETLVNEYRDSGYHALKWKTKVGSGVYFLRITAGEFVDKKKVILIK
ncbi:right-handed parallel beta-helix repeat-containing protein [candidate division KSB1 bacterium]|nr:right-handed parallel beta-helix repeat-containing protein [candidate division KSB1 bacterium]